MLVTSNFYSVLYYNSEIWHLPTLKANLKKNLRSASANALKLCTKNYNYFMTFDQLPMINNCAQPNQIMKYKLS